MSQSIGSSQGMGQAAGQTGSMAGEGGMFAGQSDGQAGGQAGGGSEPFSLNAYIEAQEAAAEAGRKGASQEFSAGDSLLTQAENARNTQREGNAQNSTFPDCPQSYMLNFPSGTQIDHGLLGSFKATAHQYGMSQEAAQGIADLYAEYAGNTQAIQQNALLKTKTEWENLVTQRATFNQEARDARRALAHFGSFGHVDGQGQPTLDPEVKMVLDQTMLGSHPKIFQMFAKIGQTLAEPSTRGRMQQSTREPTIGELLWPNMK